MTVRISNECRVYVYSGCNDNDDDNDDDVLLVEM